MQKQAYLFGPSDRKYIAPG